MRLPATEPSSYSDTVNSGARFTFLNRRWFDYLGLSATTLCLLHCLIFPLLAVVFSTGVFFSNGWVEYAFVFSAGIAVFFATRHARAQQVVLLLWVGVALLVVGFMVGHDVQSGFRLVNPMHIAAAFCMGTGHILNLRTARRAVAGVSGALPVSEVARAL